MKKLFKLIILSGIIPTLLTSFSNAKNCKPRKICFPTKKDFIPKCGTKTFFQARPQGANLARIYSGWNHFTPYCCEDTIWGDFYLTVEYTRSLKPERIAQYFFGTNCLTFSGSDVPNRNPKTEILADNFGLARDFIGKVCFKPTVENVIMEFNAKLGLDNWIDGLYFEVHAPIVRTWYNIGINCNEKNNSKEINNFFDPCYMSQDGTPSIKSIIYALSGNATWGDMQQAMNFGAFSCGKLEQTGLADLNLILGNNVFSREHGHLAGYLKTVIPTGNKTNAEFIFEPIIGNTKQWELGAGIDGHIALYKKNCHFLGLFFDAYATYKFKKIEFRSYDLKDHATLSRYLLLKEFVKDKNGNYVYIDPDFPTLLRGRLINAIDFTTYETIIGGGLRSETLVKLSYYYSKFGIEFGYNGYINRGEKLKVIPDLYPADLNNTPIGIKGTEPVCNGINLNNSTQNNATIYSPGTTNNPPVLISHTDINKNSAKIEDQITHKFFATINYTNLDSDHEAQLTIGGEYEVDAKSKFRNSLNQWGIWAKGTISF